MFFHIIDYHLARNEKSCYAYEPQDRPCYFVLLIIITLGNDDIMVTWQKKLGSYSLVIDSVVPDPVKRGGGGILRPSGRDGTSRIGKGGGFPQTLRRFC